MIQHTFYFVVERFFESFGDEDILTGYKSVRVYDKDLTLRINIVCFNKDNSETKVKQYLKDKGYILDECYIEEL